MSANQLFRRSGENTRHFCQEEVLKGKTAAILLSQNRSDIFGYLWV
jgi:hypothetical protein